MHKTVALAVSAAVAGALALTGCGPDDKRGDAGQVTGRDRDYYSSTKTWDYDLTIRRPDGSEYELDVTRRGYDRCFRGSAYPKCIDN